MDRSDMIHKVLYIGRWYVDFLFAIDGYDVEEVLTYMYDADASDYLLVQANEMMRGDDYDTGFTFSNPDMKYALVVVGPTSSGKEFINTLAHELYHVASVIASSLGKRMDSETPAYIVGDSIMEFTDAICALGCVRCNGED